MASNALEWLNENMHRNYPVVDSAVFETVDGRPIPSTFITDISILAHDVDASRFYIHKIGWEGSSIYVQIGYAPDNNDAFVCGRAYGIPANIATSDPLESKTFPIIPYGVFPEGFKNLISISGSIIIGNTVGMSILGDCEFSPDSSNILSTCVFNVTSPSSSGSGSVDIAVEDSLGNLHVVDGRLIISASPDISASVTEEQGVDGLVTTLFLSVNSDARTLSSVDDAVAAVKASLGNPIQNINGVLPRSDGSISLAGGDCTTVSGGGNTITISNPCSVPCCDTTLNDPGIQDKLSSLQASQDYLQAFFDALSSSVNNVQARLSTLIAGHD